MPRCSSGTSRPTPVPSARQRLTRHCRDLTTIKDGQTVVRPSKAYKHHTTVVNDVQYHPISSSLLGTVSDDLTLQIIDMRQASTDKAAIVARDGHSDAINSLAFNPATDVLVATASGDKTIGLWDLRNTKFKVHTLEGHEDAVTSLAWHPQDQAVLGSASYDRRIIFWDLSKVGEEVLPDDMEDGAAEL